MTNLTQQTPSEIDAQLAEIWGRVSELNHKAACRRRNYHTYADVGQQKKADHYAALAAELDAQADEVLKEAEPFNAEFTRRGGWSRYFLVDNVGGHIHRERHCSTCYPTTVYSWLVELADCDETQMVAEHGERACTVCFPEAPTMKGFGDGTSRAAQKTGAAKAAKAAEKAAKAAEKAAKAITDVDGSRLFDIKTLHTAKIAIVHALENAGWCFAPTHNQTFRAREIEKAHHIGRAIAHKTGESYEAVLATALQKANKKLTKAGAPALELS